MAVQEFSFHVFILYNFLPARHLLCPRFRTCLLLSFPPPPLAVLTDGDEESERERQTTVTGRMSQLTFRDANHWQ